MTLPNPFEPPRLDGPPFARRRVTRRGPGSSPLGDDEVPVLLRIADLSPRTPAAADPVKPEPPSAITSDPVEVEVPATIKFVPATSEPPADPTDRTDRSDRSDQSAMTTAPSREPPPPRKPPGERRRRENIPPPVETRKSVATQWVVIAVLVGAIAAVYFAFTNQSGDNLEDAKVIRDKQPSSNFVPAKIEPTPADAKHAAPANTRKTNENIADLTGAQRDQKPGDDPPAVDSTIAPELGGPQEETQERRPAPPPVNRRTAPPAVEVDAPSLDGPVEREARRPTMPPAYPETNPAKYDYAPDNRRVAAPPPPMENVYEIGTARLNGVQPLPPRDRR